MPVIFVLLCLVQPGELPDRPPAYQEARNRVERLVSHTPGLDRPAVAITEADHDATHVRDRFIWVPLRLNADAVRNARELLLYVSYDRGRNWTLYERVPPSQTVFGYRCPGDGLYCFAAAALHHDGRLERLDVGGRAEVKVAVDSALPRIRLDSTTAGDAVEITWEVDKPFLASNGVVLTYQQLGVKSVPHRLPITQGRTGRARFDPEQGERYHLVLTARDRAGNQASSEISIGERKAEQPEAKQPEPRPPAPVPGLPARMQAERKLAEECARGTPGWDRPVAPVAEMDADATHVKNRYFFVPVRVGVADRRMVRELLLYISYDRGRTWALHERAGPDKLMFDFFSPSDGLYCFTIVTVHQDGRQEPPDVNRAPVDAKVAVDTVRPKIKLAAARDGEFVEVTWQIDDACPDGGHFTLAFEVPQRGKYRGETLPACSGKSGKERFKADPGEKYTISLTARDWANNGATAYCTVEPR